MKTTPLLIVCAEPEPDPSQSNEVVLIVVLASMTDVEVNRNKPVPPMGSGVPLIVSGPRLSVPLDVTVAPKSMRVVAKIAVAPDATTRLELPE